MKDKRRTIPKPTPQSLSRVRETKNKTNGLSWISYEETNNGTITLFQCTLAADGYHLSEYGVLFTQSKFAG